MARDDRVCKLARYVYCDRETTVLRQQDSRCCSASWLACGASLRACDLPGRWQGAFSA